MKTQFKVLSHFACLSVMLFSILSHAARIKDITAVKGVRDNQLIGYGVVVGLKGTGDSKKEYTSLSMSQMFRQMGVDLKNDQVESKNVAAVVVTTNLPPFARTGSRVDVTVSSVGDAKSLQGGVLLLTPLRGGDKNVYVVAQGSLSVGGFAEGGGGGSSGKNHPTVGIVPGGGIVEKDLPTDFGAKNAVRLALNNPDFTTAARVAKTINQELGGLFARARDSTTIDVIVPYDFEGGVVELISAIERLPVEQDTRARIIVNERTGTIVMGSAVRLSTVAISHGNLTLEIKSKTTTKEVSPLQVPKDAAPGTVNKTTETVNETTLQVNEEGDKLITVNEGPTLGDVVRGLNALGVTPRDLIGILQTLKAQGALQGELELL
jgi:flagellar P-ring protein precursor FlgI